MDVINNKNIGKWAKNYWPREVLRTPNNKNPHAYISSPLYHIKNWFKELKLRISGATTKELIGYNPLKEKVDYSKSHSIKAGVEGAKSAISNTKELIEISTPQYNDKKTKALMEFQETMAKNLLKK